MRTGDATARAARARRSAFVLPAGSAVAPATPHAQFIAWQVFEENVLYARNPANSGRRSHPSELVKYTPGK